MMFSEEPSWADPSPAPRTSRFDGLVSVNLYDHQVAAAGMNLDHQDGFLNSSEMGTGKTLATIAAMNRLHAEGTVSRVLIVCPSTLKYTWAAEFSKSGVPWKVKILEGHSSKRREDLAHGTSKDTVVITNYESLSKLAPDLRSWKPDLVVADECHQIKNHKALKTKALKSLKAPRRWALTGTPMVQSPLDIWSIFDWIRPGHFATNFYAFRNRYAVIFSGAGFPIIRSWRNLPELQEKVSRFSFRVTKEECLDLPEKSHQVVEIDLGPKEREAYDQMSREMLAEVGDDMIPAQTALVKMMKLQQITSGFIIGDRGPVVIGDTKIKALEDLLESLQDNKVVIWCKFKEEIRQIEALLLKQKRAFVTMTGDTSEADRQRNVEAFQKVSGNMVLVGISSVGGLGITLTAASHCIYFSNTWSLGDRMQSEDRLHRIGQKNAVTYYDLVAHRTIDGYVRKVITKKANLLDKITGDDLRRMVFDS